MSMSVADEKNAENEKEMPKLSFVERWQQSKVNKRKQVLDPNNPMLEKFQKTLKEHLLRQIDALKEEIFGYETGASKIAAQKEYLGVEVYDGQQIVAKQQTKLDNCMKQLEKITATREENERYLQESKELHKQEKLRLIEAENEELNLKKEVESTNFLIYQMSQWENTTESDLKTKHRMLEKSNQDKIKLLKQKRSQDALIYALTMQTWRTETEIEKMEMHLGLYEEEREQLAQTVAHGNTNIEAVASECKNLTQAWNSVVVHIANRDKVITCLKSELHELEQKFHSVLSETDGVKNIIAKTEMQKNEYLTAIKNRMIESISNFEILIKAEMKTKTSLEREVKEIQGIMERTLEDTEKSEKEMFLVQSLNDDRLRAYERLMATKGALKDQIANKLVSETSNNHELKHLHKLLRKAVDEALQCEIAFLKYENETRTVLVEGFAQTYSNEALRQIHEETEEQILRVQGDAHALDNWIEEMQLELERATRTSVILSGKLDKILLKTGHVDLYHLKMVNLGKEIDQLNKEVAKLQVYWLSEETILIAVSQERQDQIISNNRLRKETVIMEQKCLKLTDVLNSHEKSREKITHNINTMRNKLKKLSEKHFKDNGMKELLHEKNKYVQEKYVDKLKDIELECLALGSEIGEIVDDKVNLSNDLIEMNRESLEWEKKMLLAKETKEAIKHAREHGGEFNNLKSNINKLKLRYSNLKKIQDRLIKDLDHCVARRDVIVTESEARERRSKEGFEKIRFNFSRKMDNMRNRMKHIGHETEEFQKKIEHVDLEIRANGYEIGDIEKEIASNKRTLEELKVEMEESKVQSYMTFEVLLQLQKRLALYNEIVKGRKPYTIYKEDWEFGVNYNKQKELNTKLSSILQKLKEQFPCYEKELGRLLYTLSVPLLAIYSISH